jgi:hypothetical protein
MLRLALWTVLGSSLWLLPGDAAAQFQYVQYRGMPAGWPNQQAGNYTAYYAPQYGQPMYYVARPTAAAYANPAYFGGYNVAAAQRPMTAAYYAPQGYAPAIYAQPTTAYYAGGPAQYAAAPAQYAAHSAYSVSPAGGSTAGAEAHAYYGHPAAVNYVPPRFAYRTTYAQVPVYMYRPVTAYQPVTGQPVTCLQPATTTQCVPQRTRYHSWFSHSWFNHSWWGKSGCAGGTCGAAPTTAYCAPTYAAPAYAATTCNSPQCGQPYYPAQPGVIIPTVPAQPGMAPGSTPGTIIVPPAGPTIPSPPTRFGPGAGGTIVNPADVRPSLAPGSGSFVPRTSVPPTTVPGIPSTPTPLGPGGSFQVDPNPSGTIISPSPATPFTPTPFSPAPSGTGSFGTGTGYAPATDPYSRASSSPVTAPVTSPATTVGPIRGPELRAATPPATIRQPASPALAPGVQTVPDPDALQPARPTNRAPQLLDPRDKTAAVGSPASAALRGDRRWAVVPAVWPKSEPAAVAVPANIPYRVYQQRAYSSAAAHADVSPANAAAYDDGGWATER